MDTKFKILPVICCLALLAGCGLMKQIARYAGKDITVSVRYPKPFKLNDTIWIKYSVDQNDMVDVVKRGYAESIPIAEFTPEHFKNVSITVDDLDNQGKNVNVSGDYVGTKEIYYKEMYYNNATRAYEANFGFVPNKKGTCKILVYNIVLVGKSRKGWILYWTFPTYIEGLDPKDINNKRRLKILVE